MDRNAQQRAASRRLLTGLVGGVLVGAVIWFAGGAAGPRMAAGWQQIFQGAAFFVGLLTAVIIIRVRS